MKYEKVVEQRRIGFFYLTGDVRSRLVKIPDRHGWYFHTMAHMEVIEVDYCEGSERTRVIALSPLFQKVDWESYIKIPLYKISADIIDKPIATKVFGYHGVYTAKLKL